jgi:hypothetical protein
MQGDGLSELRGSRRSIASILAGNRGIASVTPIQWRFGANPAPFAAAVWDLGTVWSTRAGGSVRCAAATRTPAVGLAVASAQGGELGGERLGLRGARENPSEPCDLDAGPLQRGIPGEYRIHLAALAIRRGCRRHHRAFRPARHVVVGHATERQSARHAAPALNQIVLCPGRERQRPDNSIRRSLPQRIAEDYVSGHQQREGEVNAKAAQAAPACP